jgi:tetratricopeptide (TPR) repeat protein
MVDKNKIFQKAEKYIRSGKIQNAINEYYKLLEENPEDWSVINTIGDLYVRLGKIDEAVREFDKIVNYYFKEGFYTKAIAILKKINRLAPNKIEPALKLAECYILQGLPAEAKSIYFELAENYVSKNNVKEAIKVYEKIVELEKNNPELRLNLAKLYSEEEMFKEAVDQYNWVAESYIDSGKMEEAEDILNKAFKLRPSDLKTISNLLTIYKRKGEDDKAFPLLEQGLKLDKNNLTFLKYLGTILYKKGEFNKAEEIFRKIVEQGQAEPNILIKLGKILLNRGEIDQAFEYYRELVESFVLGGKVDKAISLLGLILSKDRSHIPSLKKLAEIYEQEDNIENLFIIYEALLEEYKKKNLDSEIESLLEKIMQLDPEAFKLLNKYPSIKEEIDKRKKVIKKELVVETEEFKIPFVEERIDLDEKLKEIDFYIEQGFYKNARDLLDELVQYFPEEPRISERYLYLSEIEEEKEVKPIEETKEEPFGEVSIEDIFRKTEVFPTEEKFVKPKIKYYDLNDIAKTEIHEIEEIIKKEKACQTATRERTLDEIIKQFKEGINREIPVEDYDTRYNLGLAYKELGLYEEAIKEFEIASKDPKKEIECYFLISECFKEKGMFKEAIHWLQKALDKAGEEEQWLFLKYNLGFLYKQADELEKALNTFKEIFDRKANYRDVAQKIKEIENVIT